MMAFVVKRSPFAAGLLLACGASTVLPPPDAGRPRHEASAALRACAEAGAGGNLDTAAQLALHINTLPRPVAVPCVVASLKRPLSLVATTSMLSAQPADGPSSPRLFLLSSTMAISVVPSGAGAQLIETGEWVTATRTLKGELELPATADLPANAAYTRVEQSTGRTTCALCHRDESPDDMRAGVYASAAYRPNPGEELSAAAVAKLHGDCVTSEEASGRCDLLHALFDFGEVQQGAFRRQVALFIE